MSDGKNNSEMSGSGHGSPERHPGGREHSGQGSPAQDRSTTEKSGLSRHKRALLEWSGIIAVIGILYFTGMLGPIQATLQRAMLWTGFFDAQVTGIERVDGPKLSQADYNFTVSGPDGETRRLESLRGQVLFINVWASWCPPCVAEMPTIETLYASVGGHEDISVLLLSMDQPPEDGAEFMESRDYDLPYHFPTSRIPEPLRTSVLPTTYVISPDGQIVYEKEGIADYSSPEFSAWLIELADSGGAADNHEVSDDQNASDGVDTRANSVSESR